MSVTGWLIFGNQLFPSSYFETLRNARVFMAEDHELCTHFRYHKHKLVLFLTAMREYRDALTSEGALVDYTELSDETRGSTFEEKLTRFIQNHQLTVLHAFEIEDRFMEERIAGLAKNLSLKLIIHSSPMFLTSRKEFADYCGRASKPFMKTFYEERRRRTGILMTDAGKPLGGRYSLDAENRHKLPKGLTPPALPQGTKSKHLTDVIALVNRLFGQHTGRAEDFWLPATRAEGLAWLNTFLDERLPLFGTYEDALSRKHPFIFHSVLSPLINTGLLTPEEVISAALDRFDAVPLNSLEGFVRQIMGWREFMRGIYHMYGKVEENSNFWNHSARLNDAWYTGETGIEPLDNVIKKVVRYGYAHHIERLMMLSNIMLLCRVDPKEVYRWFMELFVDSSDWVMVPNVFGMAQWSDGGIFATKPYICGSSYWLRMSDFQKDDWCDVVDGLYWHFVADNREHFATNPRTVMVTKNLERLPKPRVDRIFSLAADFRRHVTDS